MTTPLFALPGGRRIPMQRAIAMGLVDGDGNVLKAKPDSQAERLLRKEERKANWAKRQADKPKRAKITVRASGTGTDVEGEEGEIVVPVRGGRVAPAKRRKEPEPLKPQNVTPEGVPITDEAVLAEITAKTAEIERQKAEETEDA